MLPGGAPAGRSRAAAAAAEGCALHPIDWAILAVPLAGVLLVSLWTRRHARSVAHFMAGGRNAGRYMLCTARSGLGGAVLFVALCQMFYQSGFTLQWWYCISTMICMVVGISGFVTYRYRETRALTLAQFFEMRYSRRFRVCAGALGFLAGTINYGIIPIICARLVVSFLGLPSAAEIGGLSVPTDLLLMGLFLGWTVATVTLGGQVTVLAAETAKGVVSQLFAVALVLVLLAGLSWPAARAALLDRPPGHSLVNPFEAYAQDFNHAFVLMQAAVVIYATMAWQSSHAFNASALSPHEGRMGAILSQWQVFTGAVLLAVLALCALVYLHDPAGDALVRQAMDRIPDPATRDQMRLPLAMSQMLPPGLKGMLCAVLVMGLLSTDAMHLHSWGSILVQDVVLPLRRRPLTTRQHLNVLRLGVVAVALIAFAFGAVFTQGDYVMMWFAVTQAIFTGGAGAAIIGGLYWSRGTTAGAWAGLLTGSVLSVGGILLQQPFWRHAGWLPEALRRHVGPNLSLGDGSAAGFPFNGVEVSFYASGAALAAYAIVSLLTCRARHDMQRLLHRGPYRVDTAAEPDVVREREQRRAGWRARVGRLIGISRDFSRTDRWTTWGIVGWNLAWFVVVAIGSVVYLLRPWPDGAWADFWLVAAVLAPLLIGVAATAWITVGCAADLRVFFHRLRHARADPADDGMVRGPAPVPPVRPASPPALAPAAQPDPLSALAAAPE
jgi:SSS family solute:Na+ symporter